jgi:NTP pyrophosphatase (non-canonical NTP hydrolase)
VGGMMTQKPIPHGITYSDGLETLLKFQRLFMDSLGFTRDDVASNEFLSTVIGLNSEVSEILDLLNVRTRPWGTRENGVISQQRVTGEAIDVLFYLLEVFNQLQLDSQDVIREYGKKLIINLARAFAVHAPTAEARKRAYAEFNNPAYEHRGTAATTIDLSTLGIALEAFFNADFDQFCDDAFFADPVKMAVDWVAQHGSV